jgi:antirestriction protein ArdC
MHILALYESVTNSIIADLESGVAPWVKPWRNGNTGGKNNLHRGEQSLAGCKDKD